MAIAATTTSLSLPSVIASSVTARQASDGQVPVGLRGAVSVGSGLRTGVTVVRHAVRTAGELSDARERAREALAEQTRLEREAAQAQDEARRAEQQPAPQASVSTSPAVGDTALDSADVPGGAADDGGTRRTIQAAVAAGQAGDTAPRGTFLDFSI